MTCRSQVDDKFCLMVTERLGQIQPNRVSSGYTSPKKPFRHRDMISDMLVKARYHDREFLEDVIRLVGIYWSYGSNNTERILKKFDGTPELKQRLFDMIDVYDIVDAALNDQTNPTLSRIAEAFPQISLVMAGEINDNPSMGLKLWVSDRDLGCRVHYIFKLQCFPSLIYVDSGVKAQACLLLFNLCHARGLANMHRAAFENIVNGFTQSCSFSIDLMEQRLVPLESRLKFTEYVESMAPSAELMYRVWNQLMGDRSRVMLREATAVTLLHEKVLGEQTLYLVTWKKLLNERREK